MAQLPHMTQPESFSGTHSDSAFLVDTKVDTQRMDTRFALQNSLFGANLCANLGCAYLGCQSETLFWVETRLETLRVETGYYSFCLNQCKI